MSKNIYFLYFFAVYILVTLIRGKAEFTFWYRKSHVTLSAFIFRTHTFSLDTSFIFWQNFPDFFRARKIKYKIFFVPPIKYICRYFSTENLISKKKKKNTARLLPKENLQNLQCEEALVAFTAPHRGKVRRLHCTTPYFPFSSSQTGLPTLLRETPVVGFGYGGCEAEGGGSEPKRDLRCEKDTDAAKYLCKRHWCDGKLDLRSTPEAVNKYAV